MVLRKFTVTFLLSCCLLIGPLAEDHKDLRLDNCVCIYIYIYVCVYMYIYRLNIGRMLWAHTSLTGKNVFNIRQ
jgi:NADH:ubiquinone oxidoreductase subunit 3 (subunit A)